MDGVITGWAFRAFCCETTQTENKAITLKTFVRGSRDGTDSNGWFLTKTTGPSFVIPPGNQLEANPVALTARVPILAGELIGLVADYPVGVVTYTAPNTIFTVAVNGQVYEGQQYGFTKPRALAINATIEPDADADGYGDETQDCQTADPSLHGTDCVPPPSAPPYVPPLIAGKQGKCEGVCKGGGVVFTAPINSFSGPRGDGGIYVPLRCPPTAALPCGGILYAELPGAKKPRALISKKAASKVLAKAKYSLQPGKKKTVKLDFSAKTEKFLALKRSRKVTVTIVPDEGQTTSTITTLKFPKPRKKH